MVKKNECDREMVKKLDNLNPNEMTKWGHIARLIINSKQKLGLGILFGSGSGSIISKKKVVDIKIRLLEN